MPFIVPWSGKLTAGTLVRRRHRFLLDVVLESGDEVVAHCVNPGRMEGLIRPGAKVWLSSSEGSRRNLSWIWELVEIDGILVCANSWTANKLAQVLIRNRNISGLKRYSKLNAEIKLGANTRIDFELVSQTGSHFVEVKSVQQVCSEGYGYFPDSKVPRSCGHIKELVNATNRGHKATLLVIVQRKDAKRFRPSDLHDPVFSQSLRRAKEKRVNIKAILMVPTLRGFKYCGFLPVDLRPYSLNEVSVWAEKMKPLSGWCRTEADPNSSWRKSRLRKTI